MTQSLEDQFRSRRISDEGQDPDDFKAPDLSPEEYATHTANQTATAFQATKIFEVVEVKAGVGQVHLLGRVKKDDERNFLEKVIGPVLRAIESEKECEGHVCKQFMLKNGEVKYAWAISFAANNLKSAAHAICNALRESIPRFEVTEAPLSGPPTPQGQVAPIRGARGRKGAAPVQ